MDPTDICRTVARVAGAMSLRLVRGRATRSELAEWIKLLRAAADALEARTPS